MIHFLHQQTDELLGYLDGNGERTYWDDEQKHEVGGLNILSFTMPSYIAEAEFANERNRILVRHERGGWEEYIIYNTVTTDTEIRVIATGSEIELNKLKVVTPQRREANQLAQMLSAGVDGIDWELGEIVGMGTQTRDFTQYLGGYDYVKQVANTFGVELVFRVEVSGSHVTGRYIDAVERFGDSRGKEFVAGKDIINIEREMKGDRIVTALYCVGPEPQEEGGTRLTTIVTDNDAFQRWNRKQQHIIEVYEPESDDEDMTLQQLTTYGTTELKKRIAAVVEYKIEAADLSALYPHEEAFLADQVRVIDDEFVPPLYAEARIIGITRPIISDEEVPVEKTYTIGEVYLRKKEDVMRNFQTIAKRFSTKIIRSVTAPDGDVNTIWIQTDTGHGFDVAHAWTTEFGWVAITPQSAADIGADPEGSAAAALQQARSEIADVNSRVNDLEDGIGEAFRDGIIEEAEAIAIRKYINSLNADKLDIDNGYSEVHGNPSLTGVAKTNFANAKTALNTAHTALIGAINLAILDGKATAAEIANVDTKFADYRTALGAYSTALTRASDAISTKKAADAKAEAIAAASTDATTKANAAQSAAIAAANAKAEAERVIAEAYADGIVSDEEAARIADVNAKLLTAQNFASSEATAALNAAKAHADLVRSDLASEISDVIGSLDSFETNVNGAFKDGIIEQAEAVSIEKYKNALTAEKLDLDNRFNRIYADTSLIGTPKTNLNTAKNAFNTAHTNLINSINAAILDGKATAAEKADVDTKFTSYRTALGTLITRFEEAITSTVNKKAADAQAAAITAAATDATQKASAAQTAAQNFATAKAEAERVIAEAYADGIVDDEEAARIADVTAKLAEAKTYADTKKAEAIAAANTHANTAAANAQAAAISAANAKAEAERVIAEAYADGIVSDEEAARIAQANANLATAQAHANTAANNALTAANTYADAVRSDLTNSINSVNTALSNFETDVTGAFKDGIIEQAEAASIEKYKNALVAEKLDFDNRYTRIYADTSLTGTPKTNLLSAKNAYNTAHTNLINSINAAILDGKATAAERTDVDAKFTLYRTALGTLVTRLEEAITATVNAKSAAAQANAIAAAATDAQNKATAARVAAEAVAVAEANAARIAAEAYADGVISDEEARAIAEAERVLEEARAHADMAAEALLDSENFRNALDTKLDTSALAGLVTKEELDTLNFEVDGKIAAGIEGIDFSDYATNTALQDSVDEMKKGLSSTTGLNLLRNSVGYGGLKYWEHTTATQTVSTLMSESLSTLGYGAGFYFPSAGGDKGIQQTVRVEPGTEYTLSWFINRATTGNFLVSIYENGELKLTVPDTSLPDAQFQSSYVPYTAETGELTVRFTASAGVEATLTGVMLGLGDLPTQWTSANGELFNAYVRVDDDGLIVLRIDDLGRVEGYTAMTPEEFAAYYDDNRDGEFEKVFWFNRDETVTKKLQAIQEITMGRIKIVRVEGATNRGWAFVPTVPDNF